MKSISKISLAIVLLYGLAFCRACDAQTPMNLIGPGATLPPANADAAATLVIYNKNDRSSLEIARFYAARREIPADQIVGLDCSTNEEITREEYDATIVAPLRALFAKREWWTLRRQLNETVVEQNKIAFIALVRGIPVKIMAVTAPYPGDAHTGMVAIDAKNEAAVDSELATLGFFNRNISGAQINPYFRSYKAFRDAGMPSLMLVCRLDGPTPDIVRRMINDAIDAERNGLWGFAYIDARGLTDGPMAEGDKWLKHIADDAQRHGIPVIFDNSNELFPAVYPMRNVAMYYGWYTGGVSGPFAQQEFKFNKGAVACHIHSFSAIVVRDANSAWVGPLLAHGAAATMGNVYEPFLTLTPHLDVFDNRLRGGFNFAESAYMAQRVVSWMGTCIGDPLYRPFKFVNDEPASYPKSVREWAAYRDGALAWFNKDHAAGRKRLEQSGQQFRSGSIFEGLGLLQASAGEIPAACDSFEQAQKFYTDPDDIVRAAIHEVGFLKAAGEKSEALELTRRQMKAYQSRPGATILRAFDLDLAPPAAPPKQSPAR